MGNKVKIYCVLWDTMPLMDFVIKIAEKNNMSILSQVGGCFTMTSLFELFTGKMPSDVLKKGMGHRCLEKYRDKRTKKIYTPWNSDNINSKLSKQGWTIHFHGIPPNNYIHGDIYTDSYEGGYKNRYERIRNSKKPSYSGKMMDNILIGKGSKSRKWQEREVKFIKNLSNNKIFNNTFYFIEYDHFHSFPSYTKKKGGKSRRIIRKKVDKRIFELMNSWDFNEPNSIFWFFGDHGEQNKTGKIPKAESYLSWVLFKDNTNINKIIPKTKIISIRDFTSTIMEKFCYKDKKINENKSINFLCDKERIYFVEDGRAQINKMESTTGIACKVIKWKGDKPINILQVAYFRAKNKFYYHLNILDDNGRYKKYHVVSISDEKYKKELKELKTKLKKRFKWIK